MQTLKYMQQETNVSNGALKKLIIKNNTIKKYGAIAISMVVKCHINIKAILQ